MTQASTINVRTTHATSPVRRFFQSYEQNTASGDIPALIAQFADVFMAAGPAGAQSVRSADFAHILPKRVQLVQSLGCQSTKLVSCVETELDARFAMAETRWQMTFVREGQPPKEAIVDSLFILDKGPQEPGIVDTDSEYPKIVFYLAHQDLMAALKNQGILAA